ncbi:galactokinase [Anaeromicrobium sediminis]|uniref:Galactokinase n=1 Tax=Anaeromicrobium sediminis TaxID=1478221 RepID=A0A267MG66_9FIRM|nr:galactokinase [Anaeromicrobium sediminis]PAB58574.1 galactokinase [Anaeromicrobium sediminis]
MDLKTDLKKEFEIVFDSRDSIRYFLAPGRVNLIGEHIDYNGGYVFPCALNFGTYGLVRKRDDNKIRMYSKNFKELGIIEFHLEELIYKKDHNWANYPKGVIKIFKDNGFNVDKGLDIFFYGNIPNGAGLSSSASIEMVTAVILKEVFNLEVDMVDMVKMAQRAENEFIGVNCGIMDQFAIGMGKEDNAILLDCNTLDYEYAPVSLKDHVIVIANTNKKRGLADSKYNERRMECEKGLFQLKEKLSIDNLCDLNVEQFEENKLLIVNEVNRKRAKHAVYENERTKKAVKALNNNNVHEFGKLMNESHTSLRDDYEVTGCELDTLVELAWREEGVIGSRMTGAGFGGCTVSIVEKNRVNEFITNVANAYMKEIGYEADFYVATIGHGAREI